MTVDKELFADTLPTYLTRFVGRDREIAMVLSMLHPGRLVTICGVGGAGKTRLAIEVAKRSRARSRTAEVRGEVYWVPFAAVADPTEVPAAVATGIGLTGPLGDRPLAPVLRTLRDRQALLVLDNCEQVAAACGELVASLLRRLPDGDGPCDQPNSSRTTGRGGVCHPAHGWRGASVASVRE